MRRAGFTLVELMIVVLLMGVIAVAVLPNASADSTVRLVSAVNTLVGDVEYAQSRSLAEPADPVLIRVNAKTERYWLALESDPDTPITRTNGDPYIVSFGNDPTADLTGVAVELIDGEDDVLFDAFGRLKVPGDRVFRLTSFASGTMLVEINADTGSAFINPDDE